jgi:hypothetical protein
LAKTAWVSLSARAVATFETLVTSSDEAESVAEADQAAAG